MKLQAAALILVLASSGLHAAPSAVALGPGIPVPSPTAEKDAVSILSGLASSSAKPGKWKSVVCGPLVWKRLSSKEEGLASRGIKTSFVKPGQAAGPEGRTFSPGHDDAEFYKSAAVQQLAKTFAAGKSRSANQKERDAFYAVYPFEIKGQPVTLIDAGADTMVLFADKDSLWLDLLAAGTAAAPASPVAVSTGTAAPTKTVKDIYTADDLRDPFQKLGARGAATSHAFSPEDFSIHNLTLKAIMKDRAADYALFTDNSYGLSFILRRGKLYDAKGHSVQGVSGSMNLKQKSAYLKNAESSVQTFKLGETIKD